MRVVSSRKLACSSASIYLFDIPTSLSYKNKIQLYSKIADELAKSIKPDNYLLYRPVFGLLTYIILDRYLRVIEVIGDITETYRIDREYTIKSLRELNSYSRDSKYFNQYLIANLLNNEDINFINLSESDSANLELESYKNWDFYSGYSIKSKKNNIEIFQSIFNKLKNTIDFFSAFFYINFNFLFCNKKLIYFGNVYDEKLLANGLSDSYKIVSPISLKRLVDRLNANLTHDSCHKKKIIFENEIFENIKNILNSFNCYKNDNLIRNLLKLYSKLMPDSFLEGQECNLRLMKYLFIKKPNYFLSNFVGAYEYDIYLNYFFKANFIKSIGVQHSGRGGYIAECSQIFEQNVNLTDIYITFGWNHPIYESFNPTYLSLPSPTYSVVNRKINTVDNNNVIIFLGEYFDYPTYYDCSYRPEDLNGYYIRIISLICCLVKYSFNVSVKFYCRLTYDNHLQYVEKIISAGATVIQDFNKGSARKYFQSYQYVIWDIPAGGFMEAYHNGVVPLCFIADQGLNFEESASSYLCEINDLIYHSEEKLVARLGNSYFKKYDASTYSAFFNKYSLVSKNWQADWLYMLSKF
jgi:hypothetical protein